MPYVPKAIKALQEHGGTVRIYKADEFISPHLRQAADKIRRTKFSTWEKYWWEGRIWITNFGVNEFGEYIDIEYRPKELWKDNVK